MAKKRSPLPTVSTREPDGWKRHQPKKGDHLICGACDQPLPIGVIVPLRPQPGDNTVYLGMPHKTFRDPGGLFSQRILEFPITVTCPKCGRANLLDLARLPHVRGAMTGVELEKDA